MLLTVSIFPSSLLYMCTFVCRISGVSVVYVCKIIFKGQPGSNLWLIDENHWFWSNLIKIEEEYHSISMLCFKSYSSYVHPIINLIQREVHCRNYLMVRERHRNKINTAGTFWLSKKSLVGDVDLVLCGFYFEVQSRVF